MRGHFIRFNCRTFIVTSYRLNSRMTCSSGSPLVGLACQMSTTVFFFISCDQTLWTTWSWSPNSTWLVTSQHDMTRHVRRVELMHFGCVEHVKQHGSTHSTRRAQHVKCMESCQDVTW